MTTPNIFEFATSELSQDAFICWLLSWADERNESNDYALHQTGKRFLDSLFDATNGRVPRPSGYSRIEVKKQYKRIDVLVLVNEDTAVIIEDKTDTKNHSGQLRRYLEEVETTISRQHIAAIYLKTGDQASYEDVERAGYSVFRRADLLLVMDEGRNHGVTNDVFTDFHDYLLGIDQAVDSYREKPIAEWDWRCWTGFFLELQKQLGDGKWDYVPNPGGGFMGFWWHWRTNKYLQLDEGKLCFKIEVEEESEQSRKRNEWHHTLINNCEDLELSVSKPSRFGKGTWMTVAVLDEGYRRTDASGILDVDATVSVLRKAEQFLDSAVMKANAVSS